MKSDSNTNNWKNIWEKKGRVESNHFELKDLIAIDGFDTGAGEFASDIWLAFVADIKEKLKIKEGQTILEVGCGAGAFLYPLSSLNVNIFGIDYSASLIKLCSKIMPFGNFQVSEANKLPFDDSFFDAIISNSVFQYFKSLDYAQNTILEMVRTLNNVGTIAILDINDEAKKTDYERIRREKLGAEEYDRIYKNLNHKFYKKDWFINIAEKLNIKCQIKDQNIPGYENSKFRYNVFLSRNNL